MTDTQTPMSAVRAASELAAGSLRAVTADQLADPAFPKGVSVDGRDVFKTRTVYENGKVLHQDFFASHYAPVWGGPLTPPDPPKP